LIKKLILKKKYNCYEVDLLEKRKFNKVLSIIKKKYDVIDSIINLAGYTGDLIKKSTTRENLHNDIFEINLHTAKYISLFLRKNLEKSKNASILNISSIYGVYLQKDEIYENTKVKSYIDYSLSKAGLIYLTKWLAKKLAPKIRVNCISPGGIYRNHSKRFVRNYSSKTLLKRMAKEKDVVYSILFFISKKSNYITGQNLIIDGGFGVN